MKKNQDFKNEALDALRGNWAPAVVCAIVFLLIVCVILGPSYCVNMTALGMMHLSSDVVTAFTWSSWPVSIFLYYPLMLGYSVTHNILVKEGGNSLTANMFRSMFGRYLHKVWGMFLTYLFIALWALLLVIPGIIKAFSYALTPYILHDNPELSANQAIDLSRKMMKGHKFDLFWLNLSFVGWFFLCLLTLGVGFVWFMPYVQAANAAFYQEVKREYNANNF